MRAGANPLVITTEGQETADISGRDLPVIRSLRVRAVLVPLPQPHRTASGMVAQSPLVLTDIGFDDGTVGHSMVFTYTPNALKPTAELIANLTPLLTGQPAAPRDIQQLLDRQFRLLGTQGLVGIAMAAVDMALWDGLACRHGLSLTALLGGIPKPMKAYGAVGYDGEVAAANVAESWAKQGFCGVKAKIGYPSVAEDLAVVRAVRQAVGDQVAIMVDYNQALSPVEAIERIRALEDVGLSWVEEPTLAHDYVGHAQIADAVTTPVQCGENWWGVRDMQHALTAKACDYVMPDVMKIGGVSGWLSAAALTQVHGIRVSSHLWPELSAQLLSATPTAHWLEYTDWWNPILREPLRIEAGVTVTRYGPGSGIDWHENAVERYAV